MIKKYQQGGASSQNELNLFAQEVILNLLFGEDTETKLLLLAKELPKIIQLLFLIWKLAGIDGVIKALSLSQKAARGAKLNRIKALNNACPEGYMKKGGKCKKCEKGKKLDPTKGVFHITAYFLNGTNKGGISAAEKFRKAKEYDYKGVHMKYDSMTPGVQEVIPGGVTVTSIKPRYVDDVRNVDLGNGHSITSNMVFDYYGDNNTEFLGDLAPVVAGRVIYRNPNPALNDTVYVGYTDPTFHKQSWIPYSGGYALTRGNRGTKRDFEKAKVLAKKSKTKGNIVVTKP